MDEVAEVQRLLAELRASVEGGDPLRGAKEAKPPRRPPVREPVTGPVLLPEGLVHPPDPGPGGLVLYDQPMVDYLRWHAASSSRLRVMDEQSPAHCLEQIRRPLPDTQALRLGRVTHSVVLEPEVADRELVVAGPCAAILKSGDRKGEPCGATASYLVEGKGRCGKHADASDDSLGEDQLLVPEADHAAAVGMRAGLRAHPVASRLLFGVGWSEVSGLWRDRETGVLCRFKIDRWADEDGVGVWAHLKTTRNAAPAFFEREIRNRRYHHTLAFYAEASAELGLPVAAHAIVAVESSPPYGVMVYDLDPITMDVAHDDVRRMLTRYAAAHLTGEWPTYQTGVRSVSLVSPFEAERRQEVG